MVNNKEFAKLLHEWPSITRLELNIQEFEQLKNAENEESTVGSSTATTVATNSSEAGTPTERRKLPKQLFTSGRWHAEEKVDGSQLSFRKVKLTTTSGEMLFKTKSSFIYEKDNMFSNKVFANAVVALVEKKELFNENYIYRGEAVVRPRHNRVRYHRCPKSYFVLFDVEDVEGQRFLSYEEKLKEAERVGLEVVPKLLEGEGLNMKDIYNLEDLMNKIESGEVRSFLGGEKMEGIVLKNYSFCKQKERPAPALLKLTRVEFRESSGEKREKLEEDQDLLLTIGKQYNVHARYHKAIEHLRDADLLKGSIKQDVPQLIKELDNDLFKEAKEEIISALLVKFFPIIAQHARDGFTEFYKQYLEETKE